MDGHLTKSANNYTAFNNFCLQYQLAVRFLIYVMLGTHSNFAFAVFIISHYASNPNKLYWLAVKCIFHYIKSTLDLQLTFHRLLVSLTEYIDAD